MRATPLWIRMLAAAMLEGLRLRSLDKAKRNANGK